MTKTVFDETVITVGYRDPSQFYREALLDYANAPYVLTGQTGTGKSTFAYLAFQSFLQRKGKRACFVQPTQANMGNLLYQWDKVIRSALFQDASLAPYKNVEIPIRGTVDPANNRNVTTIVTAEELNHHLAQNLSFPDYDWFIIDEYHLPWQAVVNIVMALRAFKKKNYVLISATPDGFTAAATQPRGVIVHEFHAAIDDIEFNDSHFMSSALNPLWYINKTSIRNPIVGIVVPTRRQMVMLAARLRQVGVTVHPVSERTTLKEYMDMLGRIRAGTHVIIMVPSVEAGIEAPFDILIDSGYTYGTRLDNGVLIETYRPLMQHEVFQRMGRAGRGKLALVYSNVHRPTIDAVPENANAYLQANAIITLVAMGASLDSLRKYPGFKQFRRLHTMTVACARRALRDSSSAPLIPSYKYDAAGDLFQACGGTAPGFADTCKDDLLIFKYNGPVDNPVSETFVAPIFDAINPDFDPYKFIPVAQQQGVIEAIVDAESAALNTMSLTQQIDHLLRDFQTFATTIFLAIQTVARTGPPSTQPLYTYTGASASTPEERLNIACGSGSEFSSFMLRLAAQPSVRIVEHRLTIVPGGTSVPDAVATASRNANEERAHLTTQSTLRSMARLSSTSIRDTQHDIASFASNHQQDLSRATEWVSTWQTWNSALTPPLGDDEDIDYAGRFARVPTLDASGNPVLDASGNPVSTTHPDVQALETLIASASLLPANAIVTYNTASSVRDVVLAQAAAERDRLQAIKTGLADLLVAEQTRLADTNDRLRILGQFTPNPTPVMTATGHPTYDWLPTLEFTPTGAASITVSLRLQDRFTYTDPAGHRKVNTSEAAREIMKILRPRIGLAALFDVRPERFRDLRDVARANVVSPDHKWFNANLH